MKIVKNIFSALFALVGIGAAALAIYLCVTFSDAKPMLLTPPDLARSKVVMLMNAVCDGDYEEASQTILGNPSLGVDREAADEVGVLIWDAYMDSMSFELVGECYTTENGLAQDISFSCLDMTSVTETLRERSQALLEERVAAATDTAEIYDENNEYREEFVMAVLYDAAVAALKEDARDMTVELTVNLSYQDGEWWVIADNELLDAISGGILY